MKKFSVVVFVLVSLVASSQNWQWAKNLTYSFSLGNYDYRPSGIHLAAGETGDFFLSTNSSTTSVCLSKFDVAGTEIWKTYIQGSLAINGITYRAKNIFITGTFENSIVIGNDTLISNGSYDAFIACLTTNGTFVWAKNFGGKNEDQSNDICSDKNDNIFITGLYSANAHFDASVLACQGITNMYIAKLDKYGNILLLKSAGSTDSLGSSCGNKIKTDSIGNIIVYGGYTDIVLDTCHVISTGSPYGEQFFCKLDSTGYTQWAKRLTTFTDKFYDMELDATCNILGAGSGGWTSGGWSLTNKYNSTGQSAWAKSLYQWHDSYYANAIATDGYSSFIVGGAQLHYHPDWTTYNFFVLAKYDAAGNLDYNDTIKVALWDNTNVKYGHGHDIIRDDNGDYIIAGTMKGNFNLGSHPLASTSDGVFIAKFSDTKIVLDIASGKPKMESAIYPNPSSGIFTVRLKDRTARTQICVLDVLGNCIMSREYKQDSDLNIDLTYHAKGVYFVEIISDNEKMTKKIVLQ